jgi:SNF2 family DNA or RNA helicase
LSDLEKFSLEEDHEKINIVKDILEEESIEKSKQGIVWIIHPTTGNFLKEYLKKYNPLLITGETLEEERAKILEEFKGNKKHKVLIASILILNSSVTLTNATYQVYLERNFNFTLYNQTLKRIHRISQTSTVITYILLFNKSLDIVLDFTLRNKQILTKGLVSKSFISQDQLKRIFNADVKESFDFLS